MTSKATSSGKALAAPKKLDIACGQNKAPGFKGIDIAGNADIVHDLFVTPWPIRANSVEEAVCSHFVEHIPHYLPQFEGRDGWWVFFDELYRVMKPGGVAQFIHPFFMHARAFWDPTHVRYISDVTWYYLNKEWREAQSLDHYDTKANFDIISLGLNGVTDDYLNRNVEQQDYQRTRLWNTIPDLMVNLKKL